MRFDWNNPYPTVRSPVMARNVVATSHALASQAGLRMLLKGGNAVDAAIAAAATLPIVEPISNGLGSDNFAILWDGRQLHGLNASGGAPAAWNPDYFRRKHGDTLPKRGWDTVTTPGAVAGWVALSERFGKLPFGDLLEPAIDRFRTLDFLKAAEILAAAEPIKEQLKRALSLRLEGPGRLGGLGRLEGPGRLEGGAGTARGSSPGSAVAVVEPTIRPTRSRHPLKGGAT